MVIQDAKKYTVKHHKVFYISKRLIALVIYVAYKVKLQTIHSIKEKFQNIKCDLCKLVCLSLSNLCRKVQCECSLGAPHLIYRYLSLFRNCMPRQRPGATN